MTKDTNDLMNNGEEFDSSKLLVVNTDTHTQRDAFFLCQRQYILTAQMTFRHSIYRDSHSRIIT